MALPANTRVPNKTNTKKKIWLYGVPFSGKTYLVNSFPDLLLLSTDGNYTYLPDGIPPHVDIINTVSVDGRMVTTKYAWETFKETIAELEKNQNDFKTIAVDLIEDVYEACRLYMYKELKISHESDDSFRAWDKIRTEFLSTIKRLMNLNYENIIICSHEDTSKDITKKSNDKVTSIRPNLNDKAALKIAGMVGLVARVIKDAEGNRLLSFKCDEVTFGGGRLEVNVDSIPCDYDALMKLFDGNATPVPENKRESRVKTPTIEEITQNTVELPFEVVDDEEETQTLIVEVPKPTATRERRRRG